MTLYWRVSSLFSEINYNFIGLWLWYRYVCVQPLCSLYDSVTLPLRRDAIVAFTSPSIAIRLHRNHFRSWKLSYLNAIANQIFREEIVIYILSVWCDFLGDIRIKSYQLIFIHKRIYYQRHFHVDLMDSSVGICVRETINCTLLHGHNYVFFVNLASGSVYARKRSELLWLLLLHFRKYWLTTIKGNWYEFTVNFEGITANHTSEE